MRKNSTFLLLFVISIVSFYSCNVNETIVESEAISSLVYGEWIPEKNIRVCSSGNDEIIILDDCTQNTRLNFTNSDFNWKIYSSNNTGCENVLNYLGTYELIEEENNLSLWKYNSNGELIRYYTYLVLIDKNTLYLGNPSTCNCDGDYDQIRQYTEYSRVVKEE